MALCTTSTERVTALLIPISSCGVVKCRPAAATLRLTRALVLTPATPAPTNSVLDYYTAVCVHYKVIKLKYDAIKRMMAVSFLDVRWPWSSLKQICWHDAASTWQKPEDENSFDLNVICSAHVVHRIDLSLHLQGTAIACDTQVCVQCRRRCNSSSDPIHDLTTQSAIFARNLP